MPKSKRNRVVPLSVVKKKGKSVKKAKIDLIRNYVEQFKYVYIFSYEHLKTDKLQDIRKDWTGSRIFLGKNTVARAAFGKSVAQEMRDGLSQAGTKLVGNKGLLFSDASSHEVLKYFSVLSAPAFATAGNIATETIVLDAGPLEQFPASLEPRLRELGLHTALKKGVVELEQQQTICEAGKPLTSDAARILELLEIEMAEFKINVEYCWSEERGLVDLNKEPEKVKRSRKSLKAPATPSRKSERISKLRKKTAIEEELDEEPTMEVN